MILLATLPRTNWVRPVRPWVDMAMRSKSRPQPLHVSRVSDSDPEKLRYFSEVGLVPNAIVEVVSVEPFGGPLVVIGESLLQMRDAVPAQGWNESGQWEGFRWSVASTPHEAAAGTAVALHRVRVDVHWFDGRRERSFSLVSLRPQQVDRPERAAR